jgi:hypothetical protein
MNKNEKKKMREGMKKTIGRLDDAHFRKGDKWHKANLHTVSVLCICCFIDALGKYIYGGNADKCKFMRFVENYMPDFYKALVNKAVKERKKYREFYLELFYSQVRSGLVHEYFPKQKNSGIEIKSRGCNQIVSGTKNKLIICLPELKREFENIVDNALNDVI